MDSSNDPSRSGRSRRPLQTSTLDGEPALLVPRWEAAPRTGRALALGVVGRSLSVDDDDLAGTVREQLSIQGRQPRPCGVRRRHTHHPSDYAFSVPEHWLLARHGDGRGDRSNGMIDP